LSITTLNKLHNFNDIKEFIMSLELDAKEARKADRTNTAIRLAGKYIGVITRAEKLLSKKKNEGLGISFKSDDGATANYLDLYTVNADGRTLPSNATVHAILTCTRTKKADEGAITFEKWDSDLTAMVKETKNGYPVLMGKRIGLLLQQELSTNEENGKDSDKVVIYGVFDADSELTASEVLDQKTKPEQLEKMLMALMNKPVNDRRVKTNNSSSNHTATQSTGAFDDFEDNIPF
jgi:hypothetical protein